MSVPRPADIGIYKANKKKTGAVAQFKMGNERTCLFLEVARQIDEMDSRAPYDWQNKIVVKLSEADICKMLAYFGLHKPQAELSLMHKKGAENKIISLKYQEYNGRPSYYLTVSHQKNKGDKPVRVSVPIALDEVEWIKVGFKRALEVFLRWD